MVRRESDRLMRDVPGVSRDMAKTLEQLCYAVDSARRALFSLADSPELTDMSRYDCRLLGDQLDEYSDHCAWLFSGGIVAQVVDELERKATRKDEEDESGDGGKAA